MGGVKGAIRQKSTCFITNNRYDEKTGCWNWTGHRNNHGYGTMSYLGKPEYVHRISAHCYLKFDLESDLHVLHRCDNPACFNPKHLFIGTHTDNMRDCVTKGRHRSSPPWTHCKSGHAMCGENLRITANGRRYCRTCNNRRNAQRYI